MLRTMLASLNLDLYRDKLFFSATCLAYFAFFRISEFCAPKHFRHNRHLTIEDLDFSYFSGCLKVHLKASKTDKQCLGVQIPIGISGHPVCAISALHLYLRSRPVTSVPAPLFIFEDGSRMTGSWFKDRLVEQCHKHGIYGNITTHSIRIGAATSAARANIPDHIIQRLGRWKSDCYKTYIRTAETDLASFSELL